MGLYAGFDCSTQGMAAVVIDSERQSIVFRDSLEFEEPFLTSSDAAVVQTSPLIWASALEVMLGRLAAAIDRGSLRAISGSAQQHGSVYCGETPEQLTRRTSPIWMDSSTWTECAEIEAALGGPHAVAQLTGSKAYPRFTGPQIRKFAREEPDAYQRTERIHLVSSYLASLLIDEHAPIDHSDGSGMNLMDLRRREWSSAAVNATAPDLAGKLPPLVPSREIVGALASRWQKQFDLPSAAIVTWSGDNPCSLVGTGVVEEGQLAISLGTSDTLFGPMLAPRVSTNATGHVFVSPTGDYMGITVFRNGALARERVRDECGLTWDGFSDALRATEAGNGGAMMVPWFEPEITPEVPHSIVQRVGLENAPRKRNVRAVIEAQMMALARHSAWMGVTPRTIYATGGASANQEILQVMADVFAADVYRFDSTDSAALGAALRAWQASADLPWPQVVTAFVKPVSTAINPVVPNVSLYRNLEAHYAAFEASALKGS